MNLRSLVLGLGCSVAALGCELFPMYLGEFNEGPGFSSGGEEGGTWINVYSHQVTDGEPSNIGNSCQVLESGTGTSTGTSTQGSNNENGFWIEEVADNHGLTIRAHVGEEVVDEHSYDQAFFASGALDRFVISAPNGEQFSYSVWGANDCQDCPAEPYEPLPGDVFCGETH